MVDSFPYRYMPQNALCRNDIGYLGSGGILIKKDLKLKKLVIIMNMMFTHLILY